MQQKMTPKTKESLKSPKDNDDDGSMDDKVNDDEWMIG